MFVLFTIMLVFNLPLLITLCNLRRLLFDACPCPSATANIKIEGGGCASTVGVRYRPRWWCQHKTHHAKHSHSPYIHASIRNAFAFVNNALKIVLIHIYRKHSADKHTHTICFGVDQRIIYKCILETMCGAKNYEARSAPPLGHEITESILPHIYETGRRATV